MKVVICWSHISGYMAACWRALRQAGADVYVIAFEAKDIAPFDPALLDGIHYRLLDGVERRDARFVRGLVRAQRPDVLAVTGWNHAAYRAVIFDPALDDTKKVLCLDTPLRYDWKQALGKRVLWRYLRKFDRVVVAGERAYAYAKYLGIDERRIRKGTYGIDYDAFAPCLAKRTNRPGGWPRRFLYVGRYSAEKGLDTLLAAYADYRAKATDPWELLCCGRGPEAGRLAGRAGVTDLGFVAPTEQAAVYADAGAFVLASRYDPWPLVVVEAAAAGLPLVCSTACGSTVELLRDGFNGYAVPTGDAAAMAAAMARITRVDAAAWGARSRALAEPFDAATWPARVFDGLLGVAPDA